MALLNYANIPRVFQLGERAFVTLRWFLPVLEISQLREERGLGSWFAYAAQALCVVVNQTLPLLPQIGVCTSLLVCHNRLYGLNNRSLFFQSSEGMKSKIKVPAGLVSGETFLPGLWMAIYWLCYHRLFLCTHTLLVSLPLLTWTPILLD